MLDTTDLEYAPPTANHVVPSIRPLSKHKIGPDVSTGAIDFTLASGSSVFRFFRELSAGCQIDYPHHQLYGVFFLIFGFSPNRPTLVSLLEIIPGTCYEQRPKSI
jgi:hypothetical protein